ncbi:MAG: hypothetical protein Q4E71_06835, partial [Prevotella sp.]|nr:hypothetical protein [Prevotella sp.]
MNFNEVIGQEEIKERLMKMCREDRIPHAMMFCGPRGCGKMALAMAFAYYLLEGNFEGSGERSEEREVRNASSTEDISPSSHPPPPTPGNTTTKAHPLLAPKP